MSGSSPCLKKRRDTSGRPWPWAHRTRRYRLAEPLELKVAERVEAVSGTRRDQPLGGVRDQDVPGPRSVAEPPRDDHGATEVVTLVAHGLTRGDADAKLEGIARLHDRA